MYFKSVQDLQNWDGMIFWWRCCWKQMWGRCLHSVLTGEHACPYLLLLPVWRTHSWRVSLRHACQSSEKKNAESGCWRLQPSRRGTWALMKSRHIVSFNPIPESRPVKHYLSQWIVCILIIRNTTISLRRAKSVLYYPHSVIFSWSEFDVFVRFYPVFQKQHEKSTQWGWRLGVWISTERRHLFELCLCL